MTAPLACPVCGTPPVPGARFCFHCGAPLVPTAEAVEGAERRVVTVLFGDLSEFTAWAEDLDPERVGVVTDRVLAALADTVAEYGGHVDKLTGDGLMALFGAPTTHEDDAERAVRAAEAMQRKVRRLVAEESGGGRRLGLRVGVNTGEVLAGVQAALSYTVVGDAVNTAARLSDAAGVGAVYAGRETALATMSVASWRALAPLRLKGKREPVPAYELVGLRVRRAARLGVGDEALFVGREAELGRLIARLLDAVDAGRPESVLLLGEAGIGKTRLAQELARFAGELPDARVLWARCAPYGAGRDLAPLLELLRTAFGIAEEDEPEVVARRVERGLARLDAPADTDVLRALLGVGDEEALSARPTAAPGSRTDEPLVAAVAALLTALAAEGPLVVVLDDLHWAGPALQATLVEVAARLTGRVFVLAIARDEPRAGVLPPAAGGAADPEVLRLQPLEVGAAERLLRAYLGGGDLAPAAREAVLRRAAGNPFFLGELLHLLVDRGLLRRAEGEWELDGALPGDVLPAGVQAVLSARVDALPPLAKQVLRDAAVLGVRFPLAALSVLSGATADEPAPARVLDGLDVLVERGLLVRGDDGQQWAFAHTLARDVVYASVPKVERARKHAAVATWARAAVPGTPAEVDAFVAAHAERAVVLAGEMRLPPGDPVWRCRELAVLALASLGALALARDDSTTAEDVLGRALRLADDPTPGPLAERVRRVRVEHARALAGLHRLPAAEAELTDALAADDPALRAPALAVLGEVRRRAGDAAAARGAFVRALAAAGEAGDDRVAGEALRQLGLLDYRAGRLRAAEDRFAEALALAERVGDSRGAGWALQHRAWSATTRGDWGVAEDALARARDVFARLDDAGGAAWCAGTEAFVRVLQGRYEDARAQARALLPLGEAEGDPWGVAACLTIEAIAAAELGDIETARRQARSAVTRFEGLHDDWGQSLALVARGLAERGADDPRRAIGRLRTAVRLAESGRHPVIAGLALTVRGWCHLDRREPADAERMAARAMAALSAADLAPHATVGCRVLYAQARRHQGDLDAAVPLLREAVDLAESRALLFPRRQALAHLAGALLERGEVEDAVATARRAVAEPAEDVRSRTLALRALGTALLRQGALAEARAALSEALAVAQSTGQRSEITASEKALAAAR